MYVQHNIEHIPRPYIGILNLGATKHVKSRKTTFDTYKVISTHKVYLNDDSIVETFKMGYVLIDIQVKGKIKRIHVKDVSICLSCNSFALGD